MALKRIYTSGHDKSLRRRTRQLMALLEHIAFGIGKQRSRNGLATQLSTNGPKTCVFFNGQLGEGVTARTAMYMISKLTTGRPQVFFLEYAGEAFQYEHGRTHDRL